MAGTGDERQGEVKGFRYGGMKEKVPKLISVIGDEDTCVGFLLAGIGEVDKNHSANFFVVGKTTTKAEIEESFKRFVRNPNIDVILINKHVADMIRTVVNALQTSTPAVLEIPSRDYPYNPEKDEVLRRAKTRFYSEENA